MSAHNVEPRVHERPARYKSKLANNVSCAPCGRGFCLDELRGHVKFVARFALVEVVWDIVLVAGPESRAKVPYNSQRVKYVAVFSTV